MSKKEEERKNPAERGKRAEGRPGADAVKPDYKDTVFRRLFKEKDELLKLYNAVAGKNYTDPDELEIVTLENAIYMTIKNDLAFLIDFNLYLYEHQSTVNPNMPLRFLRYVTAEYERLTASDSLYGEKLVKIPAPHFVVFYNGIGRYPECHELKLSDAFIIRENAPELELRAQVLNINEGFNEKLKEQCRTLAEYMQYVDKVRTYAKSMALGKAVDRAVNECIEQDILREFLLKNKAEVKRMSIFEYDEEATLKAIRDNAYEKGVEDGEIRGESRGYERGRSEGGSLKLVSQVCKKVEKNKTLEKIAEELEEEVSAIEPIYNKTKESIPSYDPELILEQLHVRSETGR